MLPGFRSRWTMPARCAAVERRRDLDRRRQRLARRQRALLEARRQRLALEELHDEKRAPSCSPMSYSVQMCGCVSCEIARASRSKRSRNCGSAAARRENLDGDGPVEPRVARLVDLAHAAGAEGGHDLVRAEARAGDEGHRSLLLSQMVARASRRNGRLDVHYLLSFSIAARSAFACASTSRIVVVGGESDPVRAPDPTNAVIRPPSR